ncbi:hypothetical protein HanIR_Chr01g0009351 [Helianthus annuus]|nr:hypothetical protein HanIR_Chr01g0009351 [Helianthus annuus]
MLNQKKIARLRRELEAAKLLADEKAKTEAGEASVDPATKKIVEKIVEIEKIVEVEKTVEVEKIIEKVVEVKKPCLKCLESCKHGEEKDKKISELEELKENLCHTPKIPHAEYHRLGA